jgi:uncharacterized protein with von Willebrand factor type A (vWA) domain
VTSRDGVDIVLGFARTLRHAGVPATPDRVQAMLLALSHLDVLDPADTYWAGRLTLCGDPADLERYDAAFAAYFSGRELPVARRPAPSVRLRAAPLTVEVPADEGGEASDAPHLLARASRQEVLRQRDVTKLSAAERDEVRRLLALLAPRVGRRRTRRYGPAQAGSVDLERTVRRMLHQGGEPSRLARRERRRKPRKLVLLVDVSGSMEPYSDALLRFAHAAVRAAPYRVEVFTLGTRLTRITRELRQRDPDRALGSASGAIPDWSGGTRLGDSMKAFLDLWGQRGVARGAIAVLFSDGWERGDPSLLGEQMTRLARLAHTVVWVNPHKGKDGYLPVTGGMVAALPHIDHLVAGHSVAALERLVGVIADA